MLSIMNKETAKELKRRNDGQPAYIVAVEYRRFYFLSIEKAQRFAEDAYLNSDECVSIEFATLDEYPPKFEDDTSAQAENTEQ